MTESDIELSLDFQRAMVLLNRCETPERMINLWKRMGTWPVRVPPPERMRPWSKGIEHLISKPE